MNTLEFFHNSIDLANSSENLKTIADKVFSNTRITDEDAMYLYTKANLAELAYLSNYVREFKNSNKTYFNRNFHLEPTNICVFACKFCSYSRVYKNREAGWELSIDEMLDMVKAYDGKPVTEVHIVGGVHPKMDLDFFGSLLEAIRKHRADLHIKAFTAVELDYMFKKAKKSIKEGLSYLKSKGLDSLPGGGAEIFDETIRLEIAGDKCSSDKWLEIHETAHDLGIQSNVTMLYGHIENYGHRIDHMSRIRKLQDKTGGFNAFIPLKFRNSDNEMSDVPESNLIEDLKNYAVSRIYLDNLNHVKAYWPMIGRSTAQLALSFGVDDIDGTIDDSTKIYSMAGAEEQTPVLNTRQLVHLIEQAGRIPIERDTLYNEIRNYSENPLLDDETSAVLNN